MVDVRRIVAAVREGASTLVQKLPAGVRDKLARR